MTPVEMTQEALRQILKGRFTEAVRQGRSQAVQELLTDEEIDETWQAEALLQATERNELGIVRILLIHGNPSSASRNLSLIFANHVRGDAVMEVLMTHGNLSPLVLAAQNDDLVRLRELLAGNPSRKEQTNALLLASCKNNAEIVHELLTRGNIPQKGQEEALEMAASIGHLDVIRVLTQECHFSVDAYCKTVSSALENGRLHIAQVLMENTSQDEKNRVLDAAAKQNSTETLQFLLVNYDFSTIVQRTALHSAIIEDNPKAVRFLLEYGTLSQEGQGAALFKTFMGVFEPRIEVLEILLEHGNISQEDQDKALWKATVLPIHFIPVIETILEKGTPSLNAHDEAQRYLLEHYVQEEPQLFDLASLTKVRQSNCSKFINFVAEAVIGTLIGVAIVAILTQ